MNYRLGEDGNDKRSQATQSPEPQVPLIAPIPPNKNCRRDLLYPSKLRWRQVLIPELSFHSPDEPVILLPPRKLQTQYGVYIKIY
jgi:hypothetical protein